MSYLVEKKFGNGYRCLCCHRQDKTSEWFEDRAEAIAQVPKSFQDHEDAPLEEVKVTDGTTKDVIAEGYLAYLHSKGVATRAQKWYGWIELEYFEELQGTFPGETWTDAVIRFNQEMAEKCLREAQTKLKAAQLEVKIQEDRIRSLSSDKK